MSEGEAPTQSATKLVIVALQVERLLFNQTLLQDPRPTAPFKQKVAQPNQPNHENLKLGPLQRINGSPHRALLQECWLDKGPEFGGHAGAVCGLVQEEQIKLMAPTWPPIDCGLRRF